ALLALLYGIAHRQVSHRRGQLSSLNARAQQAQAAAGALAPFTNFIALREERERDVAQLVDSRFDWAHAFHELGRVLPRTASISSIDGSVGSASATGSSASSSSASASNASSSSTSSPAKAPGAGTSSTPPGSVPTLSLSGCATSQAQVALTLTRLRLIDGVSEVTLQSSTKSTTGGAASGAIGQCPPNGPAFSALLTFDPLPSESAIQSARVVPALARVGSR
ncbi:MAG TPA: hypothetical protein VNZ05_06245, partial [Solirubrobacteraceae bacterium]|nr:hypothetical protein [Solirubrobacteraceae bacterium]